MAENLFLNALYDNHKLKMIFFWMNLVLKIIAAVCYYLGSKSWQKGQRKKSEDKEILVVDEDFENDSINFGPIEPRNTSKNTYLTRAYKY